MAKIKLVVSTGWANGNHIDYIDLPIHWDKLSEEDKGEWIDEAAQDYLHQCCEAYGELVEDDEC